MSDTTVVQHLCRPRARTKNHKIIGGGLIVGTGEPEVIVLDAVDEESADWVRLEVRIKPAIFEAFKIIAKAQGRSVAVTLRRYLNRTAIFLAGKVERHDRAR